MHCRECGTNNLSGAECCAGCGKVLAIALETVDSGRPTEMTFSQLETRSMGSITPYSEAGICSLCTCTGSEESLKTVRDAVFCAECAPLVRAGSRAEATTAASGPAYAPGGVVTVPPGPSMAPTGPIGPTTVRSDDSLEPTIQICPGSTSSPAARFEPTPVEFAEPVHAPAWDPSGTRLDPAPSRRPIHPIAPRRGFPWPAVLVFLVLGVGVFFLWQFVLGKDRIDRLLAEASSDDRSVSLAPRFEKGDSWRYRVDATVHVDAAASGGGTSKAGKITFGANTEYYLDVLDVDAAGTAELQIAVNSVGFEVEASEGDVEDVRDLSEFGPLGQLLGGQGLDDLDRQTVQFRVDRRGRPAGDVSGEEGLGTVLMGLLGTVSQTLRDRPLSPGDTWTHDLELGGGETLPLELAMVGYAGHLGRDCAVIEVKAEKSVRESQMGISIGMNLSVKGALFIDTRQGHMVHIAIDGTMDMTVSGVGGNLTIDASMEIDMELL